MQHTHQKATRIALAGACGRMGKTLGELLRSGAVAGLRWTAAIEQAGHPLLGKDAGEDGRAGIPLSADTRQALRETDVLIDFSAAGAAAGHASVAAEQNVALVLGTTGLSASAQDSIQQASRHIPVGQAAIMSLGINLLLDLVGQAATALQGKGYDIEIIERHHRRKKDAPSGTALALGGAAAGSLGWKMDAAAVHGRSGLAAGDRPERQIGFHAVRGGDIVGDHSVLFAAEGEMIELAHRATSRNTFALGALRAAAWVAGRPAGLYSMRHVLGLD